MCRVLPFKVFQVTKQFQVSLSNTHHHSKTMAQTKITIPDNQISDEYLQKCVVNFKRHSFLQNHQEMTWIISAIAFIIDTFVFFIFNILNQTNNNKTIKNVSYFEYSSRFMMLLGSLILLLKVLISKSQKNKNLEKFKLDPAHFKYTQKSSKFNAYILYSIFSCFATSTYAHLFHIILQLNKLPTSSSFLCYDFISYSLNSSIICDRYIAISCISTMYALSIGAEVNQLSVFKSNIYRIKNVIAISLCISIMNFIHYVNDLIFNQTDIDFIHLSQNIIFINVYLILSCWMLYLLFCVSMRRESNSGILFKKYPKLISIIMVFLGVIIICSLQYFSFIIFVPFVFIIAYDSMLY